jgi:hypothetical protein
MYLKHYAFIWKQFNNRTKDIVCADFLENFRVNSLKRAVLRILDVYPGSQVLDPDFYPFRIPDPKTAAKERGEKKFVVIPFFVATNFT